MRLPFVAAPTVTLSLVSEQVAIAEDGMFGIGGVETLLVFVAPLQKPDARLAGVMSVVGPPIDSTRKTTQ